MNEQLEKAKNNAKQFDGVAGELLRDTLLLIIEGVEQMMREPPQSLVEAVMNTPITAIGTLAIKPFERCQYTFKGQQCELPFNHNGFHIHNNAVMYGEGPPEGPVR